MYENPNPHRRQLGKETMTGSVRGERVADNTTKWGRRPRNPDGVEGSHGGQSHVISPTKNQYHATEEQIYDIIEHHYHDDTKDQYY
ncbi:hypothetical protein MtrunA17_Chr2g0300221 [Medicago truncatula]|nr:hypothetical protein MtrunA17_Chr2g0300221 [Medicago truncatula]